MARRRVAQTRIGISGWTYAPWRGVFYPKGLPQKHELAYASRALNSIEINGTFYSLQRPSSFAKWYDETPDDFVFSVKGGRFITHMKKLAGVETALANFFAQGILLLKEKLGPILWQLPPSLGFDADRLDKFFELLPRNTRACAKLASQHDARLKGNAHVKTDANRRMRHAIEVRHDSFYTPAFLKLLRRHDIGIVIADTAGRWPLIEEATADFVYARLHGDVELYASGYGDAALDDWAKRLKKLRRGRDLFVYFDNDVKVRAPFDAAGLGERMGIREKGELIVPDLTRVTATPRENWPGFSAKARPTRKRRTPRV